jgi:hypothetical protein
MCSRRLGLSSRLLSVRGVSLGLLLGACARRSLTSRPRCCDDAQLRAGGGADRPGDVFRLSAAMHEYLDNQILPARARRRHPPGAHRAALQPRQAQARVRILDDAQRRQAFDARSGNCLSLVIMTAACAKELGLKVTYQSSAPDEMWSRAGDMYFLSVHVNLQLEKHASEMVSRYDRFGTVHDRLSCLPRTASA